MLSTVHAKAEYKGEYNIVVDVKQLFQFRSSKKSYLKMPSKLIRILRITFCYKQLCGRCLVHMTPVVKVVIHCVFALL